ncbi:transposase family protein [Streptomyces virginiae]|uniref:transposase family protein n=1 Tax=Streptomyces virginiae TaxID=1961 RepID=UPI0022582AAC|nr:transposase family protein [Streptomyces virginiae]MCX5174262.1 transposase family protein [Streptomyces virginiae]
MPTCPRCGSPANPATLTGSRTTTARHLPICNPCGTDEAVRDHTGQPPIPPTDWPINH